MQIPVIADLNHEVNGILDLHGLTQSFQEVEQVADYPSGTDIDYLRHYYKGVGAPFVNFLAYVDVGVGFSVEPRDFPDREEGQDLKKEVDSYFKKIDFLTTMLQFAIHREVLGRAVLVKTYTSDMEDFYFNKYEKVTGLDSINPLTLDDTQSRKVILDTTNTEKFKQVINYDTDSKTGKQEDEQTIHLEQDRVYYATRNPLTKYSLHGVSVYSNCLTELRTVVRFPRYRSQMARKFANIHRHYVVNTEKLQAHPYGTQVTMSVERATNFLNGIHRLVTEQEEKGSSIATFDYIDSHDVTYAGKEPDIAGIEHGSLESLALKMELPLNAMVYGADVNRATLEKITNFFVKRRQNGPQNIYRTIIEEIANEYARMHGHTQGRLEVVFNPFLEEDITEIYAREGDLANKIPNSKSVTEIRRAIRMPDNIEYGPADEESEKRALARQAMTQTIAQGGFGQSPDPKAAAPSNYRTDKASNKVPLPVPIQKQRAKTNMLEAALIEGNIIRPLR